ncbi:tail fiber domain-containing protein [Pseudomonas sp. A34-9]|uniref:tail fiber domain-containing protein n=1 Tax=Pseudomonas sp. A34-9 TaxID=3034675 RepID=UPI00240D59D5|nr:tail fiber domain-containing protein [Pseudomonas sp. A34-9]
MPWLRGGTVAVTNGSTTVIGTNADFAANSRIGDAFIGPDGGSYEIGNVASATVISIIPAYKGPTASGVAYAIMPVQGYPKALADSFNSINRQWGSKLEALGTTGNYDVLPVLKGGTGATTSGDALVNLGAAKSGANGDITSITGMTTALSVTQGGTGGKTQAAARTGLGLGGAAVLDVGTAAGTVAAGNDSRITGAVQTGSAANVLTLRLNNGPTLSSSGGYLISNAVFFPPGYRSNNGTSAGSNQWNLFWAGSGMQVWVDGSNTGTIQYTASDERIKEDIEYVQDTAGDLSLVESLRPVTYRFSERGPVSRSGLKRGFIAQDVMQSDSALVTGEVIEGEAKDNITSILSLDSLGLVSYLVGAVQELSTKNKQLENRINAIEQVH